MVKKLLLFGKWAALILAGLLVVFSVLPWLIPVPEVEESLIPSDMQTIDCQGQNIRFRVITPVDTLGQERPAFMLLHGFCGSAWNWRAFQDSLAAHGYRSVAIDIPPFGYSRVTEPRQYTDSARVRAVRLVMNQVFPGTSWILAGHSMGAVLAGQTALISNDVQGVICVDGVPFTPSKRSVFSGLLRYPPLIRWAEVVGFRKLLTYEGVRGLLQSAYGCEPDSLQVNYYLEPILRPDFPEDLFSWASESGTSMSAWKTASVPIQLFWGSDDSWIPVSVAYRFQEKYPGSGLTLISGSGHCPMETHLQDLFPKVVHWADSVSYVR